MAVVFPGSIPISFSSFPIHSLFSVLVNLHVTLFFPLTSSCIVSSIFDCLADIEHLGKVSHKNPTLFLALQTF